MFRELITRLSTTFRLPSADLMAVRELEQAKRELLQMQTAQDYAKRMCEYHQDRVKRLTVYITKEQA
jgi:hypothetical protein